MAVVDALAVDSRRVARVERLGHVGRGRQSGLVTVLVRAHVVVGREPGARLLVRDDRRAGGAESRVAADLVAVPVRVEQRPHAAGSGQVGQRRAQAFRELGRAAVDEHLTRVRRAD